VRIVFAGTPDFAARHLQALLASEHELVAVYTQPDRAAGRGRALSASAVKQLALSANVPVVQPENLKTEAEVERLAQLDCDVLVVVAYGLILPRAILDTPNICCINVHGSLLPRWRGAAPIQRCIEAGDRESGITIMRMDAGLDTGDMILRSGIVLDPDENSASLYDKFGEVGPKLLIEALDLLGAGEAVFTQQDDSLSTYARKIDKAEAHIDWREDAAVIERRIRAFNPQPVCWTRLANLRLKILRARPAESATSGAPGCFSVQGRQLLVDCGRGSLELLELQLEGKKACSATDFINGSAQLLKTGHFVQRDEDN